APAAETSSGASTTSVPSILSPTVTRRAYPQVSGCLSPRRGGFRPRPCRLGTGALGLGTRLLGLARLVERRGQRGHQIGRLLLGRHGLRLRGLALPLALDHLEQALAVGVLVLR